MHLQILTIARNTFVEAIRQPIVFVLIMLCGVLQVLNTWGAGFSMGLTTLAEVSGDNKLLFDIGLATVLVCGMLLAAFVATAGVSREIENRTVLTVVSKPVERTSVILGKFGGLGAAIVVAVFIMLIFLLLAIRHGVMTTAADDPDQPVIVFGLSAVALALAAGVWCNYFYGWYFSQTAVLTMAPLIAIAYVLVLVVGKKWVWQEITHDIKPQIMTACAALSLAILVLTAVATAISTRLGQVMTVVACAGVFMAGLLSNYFVGRHAFRNKPVAVIREATPRHTEDEGFDYAGATYELTLQGSPSAPLGVGSSLYYGQSPNGFPMSVRSFPRFEGSVGRTADLLGPQAGPAIVVTEATETSLTIRNVGTRPVRVDRPPQAGDYVFAEPTRVSPVALTLWGVVPNMHYFWLVDAVSQNRPVPSSHLAMIAAYSGVQVVAFLALGVILFQKRDVG